MTFIQTSSFNRLKFCSSSVKTLLFFNQKSVNTRQDPKRPVGAFRGPEESSWSF